MSNRRGNTKNIRGAPGKNAPKSRLRAAEACSSASNSDAEPRRVNINDMDPGDFNSLKAQLTAYNLEKREMVGDGNCLFRSFADQLDGSQRGHMRYRREVCEFMLAHREDFEAFIDFDDAEGNARNFDEYVHVLERPGTYGDQLSIVALARLHKLVVVIHQHNSNVWQVDGTDGATHGARQVHILYYPHGDHYDSLRQIGDHSDKPTSIYISAGRGDSQSSSGANARKTSGKQKGGKPDWREEQELREQLALISYSGTLDESLAAPNESEEQTVAQNDSQSLEAELLRLQIAEIENSTVAKPEDCDQDAEETDESKPDETASDKQNRQPNARLIREQKRLEKKKRAELRHRERVLQMSDSASKATGSRSAEQGNDSDANQDKDAQLVITNANVISI